MKKKIMSVFLVVAMAVSLLIGCGESGNDSTSKNDTEAKNDGEQKFIGITVPSVGNDFMLALTNSMKSALEDAGCKVQLDSAENDVTTQISQIENFTTMGCDSIVVWAVNGDGVASSCKQAVDAGIPVVAFAYEIPGASTSIISATDEDMAAMCVELANDWIDKTFPDAGDGEVKVYVMTASTVPESVTRSEGLKKIADNPKVTMIESEVEDQDNTDTARTLTENTLLANPDVDVMLCMNGTCGVGAESYVMSSGSPITDKSKFAIFCVDETDEIDAKILASEKDESVLRGTVSLGSREATVSDFMKGMDPILKGETPVERVDGSASPLTPETLK